jgi:polar amino acid transport system substrate-binding protein
MTRKLNLAVVTGLLLYFNAAVLAAAPLRVVLELSPPHQTMVKGEVAGLTTALVKNILSHAKLDAAFEVYPWARAYKIAATTPNVLIYNMARTPEREGLFQWIGPIGAYRLALVKLKKRHDIQINKLDDARTFITAVQRDDYAADYLLQQGFVVGKTLQLEPDISQSWFMLAKGKVDLLIDDPHSIDAMLLQHNLSRQDIEFVYFIQDLAQQTWLAVNKNSDAALVARLKAAHQLVAQSDAYRYVLQLPEQPVPEL